MENHLKTVYGYNNFREYQKEIIEDLLNNRDVFAMLPTGGGKSLLYQFPATYNNKISIVISPLISLMNDQCINLIHRNIKSICLNSETKFEHYDIENINIIFTTPEFFTNNLYMFKIIKEKIGLFAIDEAHCTSQWGHDFRISYKNLGIIKDKFKNIPLLAVTATATPKVLEDMYTFLKVDEVVEYNLGTRRPNLHIYVYKKSKNIIQDLNIDQRYSTIIYTQTRKKCENIYELLNSNNIPCLKYHGGMSPKNKNKNHNLFVKDEVKVIVATISFGMGIDKPDIRNIIIYGCPKNIETYYQEIGRAGRDGEESYVKLLYNDSDFHTSMFFINNVTNEKEKEHQIYMLNIMQKYLNEMNLCRQQMIDYYFSNGEFSTELDVSNISKCMKCDNCLRNKKDIQDITDDAHTIVNLVTSIPYSLGIEKLSLILYGSNSIKIRNQTRNQYFGHFSNKSKEYCREIINILIVKNILEKYCFDGKYYVIKLGPVNIEKASPILCYIKNSQVQNNIFSNVDKHYEQLLILRKQLSNDYNINPYMIISDNVLKQISLKKPQNIKELWFIDGVSQEFILKYGNYFIFNNNTKKEDNQKSYDISYNMYNNGKSISEIADERNLKCVTIEKHLIRKWTETRENIDLDRLGLNQPIINEIKEAINIVGKNKLKPIKNIVNKNISYFYINIVVNLFCDIYLKQ